MQPFDARKLAGAFGNPLADTTEAVKTGNVLAIPGALAGDVLGGMQRAVAPVGAAVDRFTSDPYVGPLLQRVGGALSAGQAQDPTAATRYDAYVAQQGLARQELAHQQLQQMMAMELGEALPNFNPMDQDQVGVALGIIAKYDPTAAMTFAAQLSKSKGPPRVLQSGRSAVVVDPYSATARPVAMEGAGDAVPGMQGVPGTPGTTPGMVFPGQADPQDVASVRSQWEGQKKVQAYETIVSAAKMLKAAHEEFKRTRNPQIYAAVVTKYAQMLDPNSIVREAEFDRAERFMSFIDKIRSELSKAQSGVVGEKVINDTVAASDALVRGVSEDMVPAWRSYTESARGYAQSMGINPNYFWSGMRDPEEVLRGAGARSGGKPVATGEAPAPATAAPPRLSPEEQGLYEKRGNAWVRPGAGVGGEDLELLE